MKKKNRKKRRPLAPTWYLVNGLTVRKKRSFGAKLVEWCFCETGKTLWKPIYHDPKRNIIIAIREK